MTKDEAETLLDNTFEICVRKGRFSEYHEVWREKSVERASGLSVALSLEWHDIQWKLKSRGLQAKWRELNLNPTGALKGDCTTRAMTFCFPDIGYLVLNSKQHQRAREELDSTWNNSRVWKQVAEEQGEYKFFKLVHPLTRARVASMTSDLKYPTLTISSSHVAACSRGEVIDTWDSRCGRVKEIGVDPRDIKSIQKISDLDLEERWPWSWRAEVAKFNKKCYNLDIKLKERERSSTMGKNYRITIQNPTSKLVGSTTVFAWNEASAKEEALQKLGAMGFTEVIHCQALAA